MSRNFKGWAEVSKNLLSVASQYKKESWLNEGQLKSIDKISNYVQNNGIIIADEVGMGKTRIAVAVIKSVVNSGGRVVILIPPGLGYQWNDELRDGGIKEPPVILRSLRAYLNAWDVDEIKDRKPWFKENIVLISHSFTNWRLSKDSEYWRWGLLPEVYAQIRKKYEDRFPNKYNDLCNGNKFVNYAAKSIVYDANLPKSFFKEISNNFYWGEMAFRGKNFERGKNYRELLERAVGLGFGQFDLVVIDEAHKSRGDSSGLSRLLEKVIIQSSNSRRLAMTATPIDLHSSSDWESILERIEVDKSVISHIKTKIDNYNETARRLKQCWQTNSDVREDFRKSSVQFQAALSPYLIRRDKREDKSIQTFQKITGKSYSEYRKESELAINLCNLSKAWKHAICSTEALSFITSFKDDPKTKRMRLTIGNGHGLAALMDQEIRSDDDKKQEEFDKEQGNNGLNLISNTLPYDQKKKSERTEWWLNNIKKAFKKDALVLYEHPGILEAVDFIEKQAGNEEKVLVFGRYTEPMRALSVLLNMRDLIRKLQSGELIYQTNLNKEDWPVFEIAQKQLKINICNDYETAKEIIKKRNNQLEYKRRNFREDLILNIKKGLAKGNGEFPDSYEYILDVISNEDHEHLNLLARVLFELTFVSKQKEPDNFYLASSFHDLLQAIQDKDDPDIDSNGDSEIDAGVAKFYWNKLYERLEDEYARNYSSFSRFMYGDTKQHSRRMIQMAFNRVNCNPQVLIAQSMVGREGLNLHEACRIVVLLHPEWNPGVVEQQIGRVDRVGSHWCKELEEAEKRKILPPFIEIHSIIFKGTYDEHNWKVLKERWDELRAQLHGLVIPRQYAQESDEYKKIIDELEGFAPNFGHYRKIFNTIPTTTKTNKS